MTNVHGAYVPGTLRPDETDLWGKLPYNQTNAAKWLSSVPLLQRVYDFVHYSALFCDPKATPAQEIAQLAGFARYHISKDWSTNHSGVFGWGIMYHDAIAPSGRLYHLTPYEQVLWNTTDGNYKGVATMLMLGPGQAMTDAMKATLAYVLHRNEQNPDMRIIRQRTFGHGECPLQYGGGPDFRNNTDCPGAALGWVRAYRTADPLPPETPTNRFFKETGHYVSHGFLEEWQAVDAIGRAYRMIGFPISEEYSMNGLTVQDFERVRMEYHTELPIPTVLYGLVDEELLAAKAMIIHDH